MRDDRYKKYKEKSNSRVNNLNRVNRLNRLNKVNVLNKLNRLNRLNKINRLNRLNKLNRLNRLNRLRELINLKLNSIKSKITLKSEFNSLKSIKNSISLISNKIDNLITLNDSKEDSKEIIDENSINTSITNDTNNSISNNINENIPDESSKEFSDDFLKKIEDDFDDDYYRRIEPREEEIKYENYLKDFDRNNLNNINSEDFKDFKDLKNSSNGTDVYNEYESFDKYFPEQVSKPQGFTNEVKNSRSIESKSISSGPLSDKFGNINKVGKEKNEKLSFNDILNLDKNAIKKLKNSVTNNDDFKSVFGAAIFGLILIVLLFSAYYFLFYQPFQDDLATAKTNKFNELNSLFKGPLALDPNALTLTSEIELAKSPEEVNAIDIIRPATSSWREYQSKQINKTKDNFNRVMITYETSFTENTVSGAYIPFSKNIEYNNVTSANNQVSKAGFVFAESTNNFNNKNIIMDASDAKSFVNENDGTVLANIVFKKPDTVAVPILISRLQAGAGLISIGSIVDIYTLSNSSQYQSSPSTSSSSDSNSVSDGSNNLNNSQSSDVDETNSTGSDDSGNSNNNNGNFRSSTNQVSSNSNLNSESKIAIESPDISGSTVLAIMRSKDSGVISADYIKSQTTINGNNTNEIQNSKSFSTDVEEMIRGSISGGYDEKQISSLLNSYGLKLSDYER